jgi:sugar phosphate isomerase/epimerase
MTALKESGYDGVELCLEHPGLNPDLLECWNSLELMSLLQDLDLEISAVSFHGKRADWDEKRRKSIHGLELAAELETNCFISGSCLGSGAEDFEKMRLFTKEMCGVAEKHDLYFAVEPEPGTLINGSHEMRRLLDSVASDHLRLNLDVGHSYLTEADPVQDVLQWGNKIVHVHIEDIKNGEHVHLLPGRGDINFASVMSALDDINYSGFFVLDLFDIVEDPSGFAEQGIKAFHKKVINP